MLTFQSLVSLHCIVCILLFALQQSPRDRSLSKETSDNKEKERSPSVTIELPKPNSCIQSNAKIRTKSRSRSRSRDRNDGNASRHRRRQHHHRSMSPRLLRKISRIKRDYKFATVNDDSSNALKSFECAMPFKHKCLFHPKQVLPACYM